MANRRRWINREDLQPLRPFLSVFFIIVSLMIVVFAKMEERRLGYVVLKLNREQRLAAEEQRTRVLALAKITRPQHVEKVAQDRFTLKRVQNKQIIHISGGLPLNPGPSKELN